VEVWNLVFTQYNQDEAGNRTPLPKPNIDTGMGLERLLTIMAGKDTIYETDLFTPLLESVSALCGKRYGADDDSDYAMRVVAEHARALAFLIADGVMPDNEGRGYVLRRLLRRAALFGRRLGLEKPFLAEVARTAIEKMGDVYPELQQRQDFIIKVIEQEETRFGETLSTGLEIIEGMMAKGGEVSGADAFRLYDTYGFPVELTQEILTRAGFIVDMDGFEQEMEKQRERARASHRFDNAAAGAGITGLDVGSTDFVGYHTLKKQANIAGLVIDGAEANKIETGQGAGVILDATPFYAEMGGQLGDTGEIIGRNGRFAVDDTVHLNDDVILHRGKVVEGTLSVSDAVEAVVDVDRRRDIARNHTATHLLHLALRQVLGEHVQQRGSLVAPERLRFDFSSLSAVKPEELREIQRIVNESIRRNLKVYDEESSYQEAVGAGVIALFDEKYGDVVRVLKIGEPVVSAELCGGTHVAATGELGYFQIVSEGSIGAGLRRIEAVTGRGAEEMLERHLASLDGIADLLQSDVGDVAEKVSGLSAELEKERKRALALEKELSRKEADALLEKAESVNGVSVLAAKVSTGNQEVLREMADFIRDRLKSVIIVLGAVSGDRPLFISSVTPDLVEKGYSAGDIVKKVAAVAGGGGGGKAAFAQGSGKDKARLDEALALVKTLM
jgi:alanyl-tRNA synthetase